jgi:hypothetical protein
MSEPDSGLPKQGRRWMVIAVLIAFAIPAVWYLTAVVRARVTSGVVQGLAGQLLSVLFFVAAAGWLGSALFPGWWDGRNQRKPGKKEKKKAVQEPVTITAAVIVHESGIRPRRIRLEAGENVAGTSPGCEIALSGKGIAPRHLAVEVAESGETTVRDLGTGLPSTLNGEPLGAEPQPFRDGDMAGLGKVRLERVGG